MTSNERNLLRELIDDARRKRVQAQPGCISCGTPYDELNPGCGHCTERHRRRRERLTPSGGAHGWCAGCGQRYYEHTPGCLTCKERHRGRARYQAGKKA